MVYKLIVFTDSSRDALKLRRTWIQVRTEDEAVNQAIIYSGTELRVDVIRIR